VITSLPVITGSITHHTASEASGVQTIARQTTTAVTTPWLRTTTTTPVTVATYSDGSTTTTTGSAVVSEELFNKVDLSESNDSLSGRIDQHDNLAQLNRGLNRGLNVNAFRRDAVCADTKKASDECRESVRVFANGSLATSGMSNGYSADTKLYGLGFDFAVTSNWRLGAQVNRVSTKMAGVDSLTQQNKDHYGVYSIYNISGFTVVNNFGYASDAINSNRNIEGVFENSHSVNGRSKWVQNRIYSPNLLGMNPFVGYSWGRAERNAYVENGSIQSARAVDAVKGSTSFSEAGVRFGHSFGKLSLAGEASVASDGFKVVDAAVSYSVNQNSILSVGASRQVGNDIGTNVVSVRGLVRF
jgi:hypothetical protein